MIRPTVLLLLAWSLPLPGQETRPASDKPASPFRVDDDLRRVLAPAVPATATERVAPAVPVLPQMRLRGVLFVCGRPGASALIDLGGSTMTVREGDAVSVPITWTGGGAGGASRPSSATFIVQRVARDSVDLKGAAGFDLVTVR